MQYAIYTPVIQSVVGSARLGDGLGLTLAITGLASIPGPSLGGFAFDMFHDYSIAFVLSGTVLILSALLLFLIDYAAETARLGGYAPLTRHDSDTRLDNA